MVCCLAAVLLAAGCVTVYEDGGYEWGWSRDGRESGELESGDLGFPERLRAQFARHDPDAARLFWSSVLNRLHGQDIEKLAAMSDTAEFIAENYAWVPGIRDYAGWLGTRQAYFEASRHASDVNRQEQRRLAAERAAAASRPAAGPTPPRPAPRPPVGRVTAFTRAPVPPSAPRGRSRGARQETVETGRAYWRAKVERQPAPVNAAALIPLLEAEFRKEGVPEELVWVAEVESSFNPLAKSPVGAAGLFQLMPRTAVSLGLGLAPEDQRLDPAASAGAAARYLRMLHNRFGNWSLALAAYNAGQGRVSSLCRKHGRSFDAIAPELPLETRLFVPRVLETVRVRTDTDPETLPGPRDVRRQRNASNSLELKPEP